MLREVGTGRIALIIAITIVFLIIIVSSLTFWLLREVSLVKITSDLLFKPPSTFRLTIHVMNNADIDFRIDNLYYSMYIGTRLLTKGYKSHIHIPAHSQRNLEIRCKVNRPEALELIKEASTQGPLKITINIRASIPIRIGNFKLLNYTLSTTTKTSILLRK